MKTKNLKPVENLQEKKSGVVVESDKSVITLPATLTVRQLADLLNVSAIEVIKRLMKKGIMASLNQVIDFNTAAAVAAVFGFKVQKEMDTVTVKALRVREGGAIPRPPVITIMGHVDHGKTTLLDAIRQSNVAATEAGAITQHIGAYQVEVNGRKITFLDTPGHEAFTAMRARGAQVTDIVVLVVAADDGVMPQTVEAINHARAAGVPIVVAINKIDKANANPERVKRQLADLNLVVEEWGGDVVCVPISAKTKKGIPELLENLLLVADILELRAEPNCPAKGVVIEAKLDKSRGPVATLLIQMGTLNLGDALVVGSTWGKVKAMFNDRGQRIEKAEPATPVEILGLNAVPQAGDIFQVVEDERQARLLAEERESAKREGMALARPVTLSNFLSRVSAGQVKELNIILKTDVQGSIEPIKTSVERFGTEEIKVKVIHSASGSITESDVLLALASKGIVIGFNTKVEPGARRLADLEGVSIRNYEVIYDLVGDVEKALKGMIEPTYAEVAEGHAEVLAIFPISKKGKVAGVRVKEGKISRDSLARILRQGKVICESRVSSLKRFKDDVSEVSAGLECGVGIEGFTDFAIGDIIQFYRKERIT